MGSYFKGILVGISIVVGSLFLMGYTSSESGIGRYQVSTVKSNIDSWILETIIDTKTGKIISREEISVDNYK